MVVDVGPARTADRLLAALRAAGVARVDYVFLSHIHIDHSGGLAPCLEAYPMARAVCHAKGLRFLVDPEKLWQGSRQVLGRLAEAYGPPAPVPADRLIPHDCFPAEIAAIVETPGHAPHHLSYRLDGRLFSGEASGNLFHIQGRQYLRPATPHRFFLPEAEASVDRLLSLPDQPIHVAHFGRAESSHDVLGRFRAQLHRWHEIVRRTAADANGVERPELETRCVEALISGDPEMAAFGLMSEAARERERFFIANSVRGYLGYIEENP
ncbi:MAG: MBL fold metallo-hydrolase [Deltaproteobacteria bacterium]|nr:MBL fold metallo-hydrolase [Deltaproteobacteria bacterium]